MFKGSKVKPILGFNNISYVKARCNYFPEQLSAYPGTIDLGNDGIEYESDNLDGFLQIPYREIKLIRIQKIFKIYKRGMFVTIKDGRTFNLVCNKMGKIENVLNDQLPLNKIRDYHRFEKI